MSEWRKKRAAGLCGRCGQRKPARGKSRCDECADAVNAARRKWADEHPAAAQATRNAYWKTAKGKAFIKRRRPRYNEYRKAWRAKSSK